MLIEPRPRSRPAHLIGMQRNANVNLVHAVTNACPHSFYDLNAGSPSPGSLGHRNVEMLVAHGVYSAVRSADQKPENDKEYPEQLDWESLQDC